MTSTSHQRSVHVDAPAEKVFDHVKDPENLFDAMYDGRSTIVEKEIAPDAGKGSTWQWQSHLLFLPFHGTMTREEYVPQERIVDRSSTGVLWTFMLEPDETGTTLTMEVEVTSSVPFLDKIEDKVFWKGDQDLDAWLGRFKEAIEA